MLSNESMNHVMLNLLLIFIVTTLMTHICCSMEIGSYVMLYSCLHPEPLLLLQCYEMEVNNNSLLHWLDRVIVPLNRTYQCSHICLYGKAFAWSIVVPFTSITKEGRLCVRASLIR